MNRIDIDLITREVLAALKERTEVPAALAGQTVKPLPEDPALLRITGTRVVTLETLDGRLDGLREIIVPKNAVLTPSVRDELKKRKIKIARESETPASPARSHGHSGTRSEPVENRTLRLLVQRPLVEPAVLLATLRRDENVDAFFFDGAEEIVQDVLERLPQGRNVALTTQQARLLCLANRHTELWAVAACDPKQVAVDAKTVGANLLVVDPKRFAPYRLAETVRAFAETCKH